MARPIPPLTPATAEGALRGPRRVRLLDDHTVNQIAAGEVVERPSSALKELLENALDAGATRIDVELEDAGRSLLMVRDDGCGMDLESAQTALLRHATSKIIDADDLASVASYGFRGEALPSIASVARLTVETGCADGVRHLLTIDHGTPQPPKSVGGPQGTTITVEDLFSNVPARLKFLKSDTTELSSCMDVVSKLAVVRPDVAFTVRQGGGVLLQTSGSSDPQTAIAEVWGRDNARALVPIEGDNGAARVTGFVSPPHFTKPTRSMQWFFVNGRPVRSRTLTAALDQAFRALTPDRRFPLAVLSIWVDPAELDVNVSPTKSEVKFRQEGGVFDAVRRSVKQSLLDHGMVPTIDDIRAANEALEAASGQSSLMAANSGHGHAVPDWAAVLHLQSPVTHNAETLAPPQAPDASTSVTAPVSGLSAKAAEFLDGLRVLGQVDDTFIIAENRRHLMVIDQHVAHERVLYEMLCTTRGALPVERQPLLTPETVHIDKRAATVVSERLDDLREIGFELEPFGSDAFLVRSVPALFRGRKPLEVLRDLMDEIADGGTGGGVPTRDEVYVMCSCKMAVKAGDKLGHAEMEKLLVDLAQSENPYLCPHGRPITIVLEKGDLLRRFKR